jgi:hypothetical protein
MHIILFEGDYVLETGAPEYSRVVDIIDADTVLLANGRAVTADVHTVENYCSAQEYWELTSIGEYRPQNEY